MKEESLRTYDLDNGTGFREYLECFQYFWADFILHTTVTETTFVALVSQILDCTGFASVILAHFRVF
jgi:hypothetical protein